MKKLLLISFLTLGSCSIVSSFSPTFAELYLTNESSGPIVVKVYPVSMIFNNLDQYNLTARHRKFNFQTENYDYLGGTGFFRNGYVGHNCFFVQGETNCYYYEYLIPGNSINEVGLNYDRGDGSIGNTGTSGTVGAGRYAVEIFYAPSNRELSKKVYVEWDGHPDTAGDIIIIFRMVNNSPEIFFASSGVGVFSPP